MNIRPFVYAALVVLMTLVVPATQTQASELQARVNALAKKVADLLKDNSQSTVAIGEFTGPADVASNSGPGIQRALVAALEKLGTRIDQKASLTVKGEYLILDDDARKDELIVRLILNVRDKKAVSKGEISEDLTFKGNGNEEIIKLLGLQVDLSEKIKAVPKDRNPEIKRQIEHPPLKIADTQIKTKADSTYAVEVLVRKKGEKEFKAVTPTDKDGKGFAFVELNRGDVYKLRLHNTSKLEAVASVTIDGLDAFSFYEPAAGRPTSFLIAPNDHREIGGWPRSTEKENEFLVGSYSDSAAAKVLRGSAKLGTITLCFHPCWEGQTPPKELEGARSIEPNGTGIGKEVKRKSQVVQRTFGPLIAAITIRYNK